MRVPRILTAQNGKTSGRAIVSPHRTLRTKGKRDKNQNTDVSALGFRVGSPMCKTHPRAALEDSGEVLVPLEI
jgi:hypothetical protein